MDDELLQSRLSQIATQWTLIQDAHGDKSDQIRVAQSKILEQYLKPIYRYLTASLGSADAADEVLQEFAVRFLKGGFRGASPDKGRFRNYLKTALGRMVIDYRRKRLRDQEHLTDRLGAGDPAVEDSNPQLFDDSWRTEILNRVWNTLQQYQQKRGNVYYSVLRFRAENPDMPSHDMAEALSEQLPAGQTLTSDSVRQSLRRAREKFAAMLIDEVGTSIGSSDLDLIERELVDLELLQYCQSTMQRLREK